MTKKETPEETTTVTAETPETPEVPKFETGFLVIKSSAGSWHVLTDLSAPLSIERETTLNEVRVGSSEVAYSLGQQQLAALIMTALAPQSESTIEE
jgi:hypothetical protein